MREIRFRVWDSRFKKMYTDSGDIRMNIATGELHGCRSDGNVDYWQAMQFTGLHDCEGREIWEGDIVKLTRNEFKNFEIDVVVFEGGAYKVDRGVFIGSQFLGQYEPGCLSVIGNIHENPELLNET